MAQSRAGESTPGRTKGENPSLGHVPKPEELFNVPMGLVRCLVEIAPKVQASGAWWSLGGDMSENLLDVHVRPIEIELLTDADGFGPISAALSSEGMSSLGVRERKLDREAQVGDEVFPVYSRSTYGEFTTSGVKVTLHGDYQLKVGEWEWGDPLMFEPGHVNIQGLQIPLMPLRLKSELYLLLGWDDRAKLIADAYARSHAFLHPLMDGV